MKLLKKVSETVKVYPAMTRFIPKSKEWYIFQSTNYCIEMEKFFHDMRIIFEIIDGLTDNTVLNIINMAVKFLKI